MSVTTEPLADWRIFTGTLEPHNGLARLPEIPPWRPFGRDEHLVPPPPDPSEELGVDYQLARSFRASNEMIDAVNTALYLRRPLLVTGKPGNGKSSLIRAVARELRLGPVLRWSITSRSTLKDGLYLYDALGRLDAPKHSDRKDEDISQFIELGPVGTALLPSPWPRALLIDEIDKSDLDLPNDLLNILEEGEYTVPELARLKRAGDEEPPRVRTWRRLGEAQIVGGHVRCTHFPFVVMTSNREREFAPAFMRRCVRISIEDPKEKELAAIVASHFDSATRAKAEGLIQQFLENRASRELATDQLLNAVYLICRTESTFTDAQKQMLIDVLYKPISGPEATR